MDVTWELHITQYPDPSNSNDDDESLSAVFLINE